MFTGSGDRAAAMPRHRLKGSVAPSPAFVRSDNNNSVTPVGSVASYNTSWSNGSANGNANRSWEGNYDGPSQDMMVIAGHHHHHQTPQTGTVPITDPAMHSSPMWDNVQDPHQHYYRQQQQHQQQYQRQHQQPTVQHFPNDEPYSSLHQQQTYYHAPEPSNVPTQGSGFAADYGTSFFTQPFFSTHQPQQHHQRHEEGQQPFLNLEDFDLAPRVQHQQVVPMLVAQPLQQRSASTIGWNRGTSNSDKPSMPNASAAAAVVNDDSVFESTFF